jgi:hypothetical protein
MARSNNTMNNPALLEAALAGLEHQKARVEAQIEDVRGMLGGRRQQQPATKRTARKAAQPETQKRTRQPLSAAARKRIAAAQKKRWAAYRKETAGQAGTKKSAKKARR